MVISITVEMVTLPHHDDHRVILSSSSIIVETCFKTNDCPLHQDEVHNEDQPIDGK